MVYLISEPSWSDRVWFQGCVTKSPLWILYNTVSRRMTHSRLIIHDKVLESADHACPSCLEGSNCSYLRTFRFLPLYKEKSRTPKLSFVRASWSPRHYPSTPAFLPSAPLSPSPWMWQAKAALKVFPVCTTMQGDAESHWPSLTPDVHGQSYACISITHISAIHFKKEKIDKISCYLSRQVKHLT